MGKPLQNRYCLLAWCLVVGGVLGALVSCAPIKGYRGPERQKDALARVAVSSTSIHRATVDGVVFGSPGILLLPGPYHFQLAVSHGEEPYSCRPYTILDTVGFDQCQRAREEEIRQKKKRRDCSLSTYVRHRKICLRDYRDSTCEITLPLAAGTRYELEVPPSSTVPPSVVAYTVSGGFFSRDYERLPASGTCHLVQTRTVQEDYEGW